MPELRFTEASGDLLLHRVIYKESCR